MLYLLAIGAYFAKHASAWNDDVGYDVYAMLALLGTTFWAMSTLCACVDRCPAIRRRLCVHPYRVNGAPRSGGHWFRERVFVPTVLANQLMLAACAGAAVPRVWTEHASRHWRDWDVPAPLSADVVSTAVQLLVYGVGFHVVFHVGHRVLHAVPWLRSFHVRHHGSLADCGVTSMYMHPVDALVEVVAPLLVPWLVLGLTPAAAAAAMCVVAVDATVTHSGYYVPYVLSNPTRHIEHHVNPGRHVHTFDLPWIGDVVGGDGK